MVRISWFPNIAEDKAKQERSWEEGEIAKTKTKHQKLKVQRTPSKINTKIICRYSNYKQMKQREKKMVK